MIKIIIELDKKTFDRFTTVLKSIGKPYQTFEDDDYMMNIFLDEFESYKNSVGDENLVIS